MVIFENTENKSDKFIFFENPSPSHSFYFKRISDNKWILNHYDSFYGPKEKSIYGNFFWYKNGQHLSLTNPDVLTLQSVSNLSIPLAIYKRVKK